MSETVNIAQMAIELANEILPTFNWNKKGPSDISWSCAKPTIHRKKDHPTDALYTYNDPYDNKLTYVIVDFKSLAEGSITPSSIGNAVRSLALTLDCSRVSEEFKQRYPNSHNEEIKRIGCLFVYNHDQEYRKNLYASISDNLKNDWPKIPSECEIILLEPVVLNYLKSIYNDYWIEVSRKRLSSDNIGIYHPDLQIQYHKKSCSRQYKSPLMLEQFNSPFQVFRYATDQPGKEGFWVYYREKGESVDEFIHIIDYLFTYQVMDRASDVIVKLPYAHENARVFFEEAKVKYAYMSTPSEASAKQLLEERMSILSMKRIDAVRPIYSEIDIGMKS